MIKYTAHHLKLLKSFFRGREDVFALRWDKEGKSGYMPAYSFDPYRFRAHKMKGGTFQNFTEKSFLTLTDEQIIKHLNGEHFIGIYPLLQDNTSWFIVADFDEGNWAFLAQKFITVCHDNEILAYLERSRSGNGGHVWIFFDAPIPAFKSRKIILSLLVSSNIISVFDKNSSFDRLFPNQDFLSGKGMGNLIALPFNGIAMQQGNTCFIDPETLFPYTDQWHFITQIKRTTRIKINKLFEAINDNKNIQSFENEKLNIHLSNHIQINRNAVPPVLLTYIKQELNFSNTAFVIRKKIGHNTFGTDRYFRFIEEEGNNVYLPKGFIGKLIRFCSNNSLDYNFSDERTSKNPVAFTFQGMLRPYQQESLQAIEKKDIGVIVAPPGSGKTVLGLKLVADKQQPTLIVVHRKQLAAQWIERIVSFLGISQKEIGNITQRKSIIGTRITVATIQSLAKADTSDIYSRFGLIIVDECHHIPAETFRNTIGKLNSQYLYGLTATPFRKYNDGKLIFIYLGETIVEINSSPLPASTHPKIIIRNTSLNVPFNGKTDRFETLSKILIHDSTRNKLILEDVSFELKSGRKCIILTERREHIETIQQYLKQSFETITLSGEDTENSRKGKWNILQNGNYQVLITTGQFFGEGSDLQNAGCLFLTYPFSFEGKLIQYIGRVQRSEVCPIIYDYRDIWIDYLDRMFLKRNVYYRKLEKHYTLFDFPVVEQPENESKIAKDIIIEKEIKTKISDLEFLYGSIQFQYSIAEYPTALKFDIEHLHIRPEFEVLKPYFEKLLKSKTISCSITVIINHKQQIVALAACSSDLEKLNQEIIESVRFRFTEKNLLGKKTEQNKRTSEKESEIITKSLYDSTEELLSDVLNKGNYRHHRHLQYLAQKHEGVILKIRFILMPFSFIFLLEGIEQYHLIMETLDTAEATYLWHLPKNIQEFKAETQKIDQHLNFIRHEGRQKFLESNPSNFSRVLHDYTYEKRGFIIWRDLLEEKLF